MKIVFATNNLNKLTEIRKILGNKFEVVSLSDIGCKEDIPEKGQTLKDNALIKARYVYDKYHIDCFADDTGLEVDALGGAQPPVVFVQNPEVLLPRIAAKEIASTSLSAKLTISPIPSKSFHTI